VAVLPSQPAPDTRTARVAHDVKNLAALIEVCADTLRGEVPSNCPAARECLGDISGANARIVMLANELIGAVPANPPVFQRAPEREVDAHAVIARSARGLRRILGHEIDLVLDLTERPAIVAFPPLELEQILINLALNAQDAMPHGGYFWIETRTLLADVLLEQDIYLAPDGYVVLTVSDTGAGMDELTRARAFEPFFTTKVGKGSGLGLARVAEAVRVARGHVALESRPGFGSAFRIYLPRAASDSDSASKMVPSSSVRGQETVLLVEADTRARRALKSVLTQRGYEVLDVPSAAHALDVAVAFTGPIDLLVTDAVLPNACRKSFVRHMMSLRPEASTLLLSGYRSEVVVRQQREELLRKPFTATEFAGAVRGTLDCRGAVQ
jgi:CheY-like chemotaxis protein